MKSIIVSQSLRISGVTGTNLQRNARYLDSVGHCRDQPVDSLTDTMSDTSCTDKQYSVSEYVRQVW